MTADLFHIGHLRAIRQAYKKCDYLIIGLLDCSSYKKPIIPFKERKEILEALPEVCEVRRQTSLKPNLEHCDFVFSGDGFEPDEKKSAEKHGCKTVKIKYYNGQTTTKIKEKISRLYAHKR